MAFSATLPPHLQPFEPVDLEVVNAARLAVRTRERAAELKRTVDRHEEQMRLLEAANGARQAGLEEGYGTGRDDGMRMGITVGALSGAFVTAGLMLAVPRLGHVIAGWFA